MIYQPPSLTTLDEHVLDEIRGCHDGLKSYLFRPRRWYKTLSRVMIARAVHGSTSIEGYHSTVAETAAVLDGEDVPHASIQPLAMPDTTTSACSTESFPVAK